MAVRQAWFPDDWAKYPVLVAPDGDEVEGPRSIRLIIDATAVAQTVDVGDFIAKQILSNVQAVKIDNSESAVPVTLQSTVTGDRITIPGESMAILPWQFTANDSKFSVVLESGTATVVVWLYNTPKAAAVWYTQGAGNIVTVTNTVTVKEEKATAGARTSVAAAVATTLLLASLATRKGGTIFNDSASATLYVALGAAAASLTSYTAQIAPLGYYEIPENYTGDVRGIWSAAVGNARITELS